MSKVTTHQLAARLATLQGLSVAESREVVSDVLTLVREALLHGHSVGLRGVGTLEPYRAAPRYYGLHGSRRRAPARKRVRFVISGVLRDDLRGVRC